MSLTTYTLGNNNAFAFGSSAKVTAGLSNSITLGAQNSVTVGTSTSLQTGGMVSASVAGNIAWSHTSALSIASGPALSLAKASTTQARDTVRLTAGCGVTGTVAWAAAERTLSALKGSLVTLSAVNAAIGAGAALTTQTTTAGSVDAFDKNKQLFDTTMETSLAAIGANTAFGVSLALLMKKLSDLMGRVIQVATLQLDAKGAVLQSDHSTITGRNVGTLDLGRSDATLSRVTGRGELTSQALRLGQAATSLSFESGSGPVPFVPTKSSALVLDADTAQLWAGAAAGMAPESRTRTGPSLTVSGAGAPTITAQLGPSAPDHTISLASDAFQANVGPDNGMAIGSQKATLTCGPSTVELDPRSASIAGGGTTILASGNGATVNGVLIKLG